MSAGACPAANRATTSSIYQEGIRVPPVQIYAAGKRRADVLEMFLLNSRMPHYGEGDLMAQMASCARGAARVQELFAKYGHETMLARIDEMLDATERRVRSRIRSELEGRHLQRSRLARRGRRHRRARSSSRSRSRSRTAISRSICRNARRSSAAARTSRSRIRYATAYFCLKSVVDPFVPTNEGLYRTVSIVAPEGLVVNPVAPAAVSSRNMTSMILAEAINNALGQAAPTRSVAAGGPGTGLHQRRQPIRRRGRYFINYENLAGGQGARCTADGMDVVMINMTNTSNLPIEAMEIEFPLRIERYELVCDSGGAGPLPRRARHPARHARCSPTTRACRCAARARDSPRPAWPAAQPGGLGAFIRNPGTPSETRLGADDFRARRSRTATCCASFRRAAAVTAIRASAIRRRSSAIWSKARFRTPPRARFTAGAVKSVRLTA